MSSGVRAWLAPPLTALLFLVHPIAMLVRPTAQLGDPGIGWHLAAGRYIVANGVVPDRDIFSFTIAGRPGLFMAVGSGGTLSFRTALDKTATTSDDLFPEVLVRKGATGVVGPADVVVSPITAAGAIDPARVKTVAQQGGQAASAVNDSLVDYARGLLEALRSADRLAEDAKGTLEQLLEGGFALDERFGDELLDKAGALNQRLLDGLQGLLQVEAPAA